MSIPVVDLIGPPGSGKTSLVDCVLNCRGLNSRPVITRPAIAVKKPRRYCSRFGRMAFALSNKSSVFNKILLSGESSIKKKLFGHRFT